MAMSRTKVGAVTDTEPTNSSAVQVADHEGMAVGGPEERSTSWRYNEAKVRPPPPLEIAPGVYGGVETPMAYKDGVVYAALANLATTLSNLDGTRVAIVTQTQIVIPRKVRS